MLIENPEKETKIKLVLEDGTVLEGYSFGAKKSAAGEVVFNTGMVGYPESLTDPSYKGQILALTYPLVGNYGVPSEKITENQMKKFFESKEIQIEGLIVSDYSHNYHHWNAAKSLADWLIENDKPAIYGIDTRALTKKLREKGTMLGKIVYYEDIEFDDPNKRNLVSEVSIKEPVVYGEGGSPTIMAIDCGIKNNIIRCLLKRGAKVIRVPWDYPIHNGKHEFSGLFISNGPGDPKMCRQTIENIKTAMEKNYVVFGICLGNQLLALAAGADTYKLKYGHRSQNQPCVEEGTRRCYITSQNHGFAVNAETLPDGWQPWFTNANDNTNEGIRHSSRPWMSVQFHPEATCGPVDTEFLFDKFLELVKENGRS
jgi:carbamoyl-phosphate synthase small subunit